MSPRTSAFLSLALAIVSVLGTLTLAYGLVYPSGALDTKLPIVLAIFVGVMSGQLAAALALRAHRRANAEPERFFALVALVLGAFFSFVMVLGFGIPVLLLGVHD